MRIGVLSGCRRVDRARLAVVSSLIGITLIQGILAGPAQGAVRYDPNAPRKALWLTGYPIVGDRGKIAWKYSWRSGLTGDHKIWIRTRPQGQKRWKTLVKGVPLKNNFYIWDASNITPGRASKHQVWIKLIGKRPRPPRWPYKTPVPKWRYQPPIAQYWVDHVPPSVAITSPSPQAVQIPGTDTTEYVATASGMTPLTMKVSDVPNYEYTRYRRLYWRIEGPVWTIEGGLQGYSFTPGVHTVWAIAIDQAGNKTISEPVKVIGIPEM